MTDTAERLARMPRNEFIIDRSRVIESWLAPDQIARTLFEDFYMFARPILRCFAGDLMHDANRLAEFERDCILRIAMNSRDDFTYKVQCGWSVRETGTDYVDHLSSDWAKEFYQHTVTNRNNVLRVGYSLSPDPDRPDCSRMRLWRNVYAAPASWQTDRHDDCWSIYAVPSYGEKI